jgi:hypothetical protein
MSETNVRPDPNAKSDPSIVGQSSFCAAKGAGGQRIPVPRAEERHSQVNVIALVQPYLHPFLVKKRKKQGKRGD